MSVQVFHATETVTVRVVVKDRRVFERGQEKDWQDAFYGPMDVNEMVHHLASNAIRNGILDASRLDGFADLARDAVTMDVVSVATAPGDIYPEEESHAA